MALKFLVMLIRHDYPLPTIGVKLLVNGLINDALVVRKVCKVDYSEYMVTFTIVCMQVAIAGVILVLQQQKRKCVKVPVDVEKQGIID